MIKITILALTLTLTSCSAIDAYETAKKINDDTFLAAVSRFCGLTASLAANRHLTDAEIISRHDFCEIYRLRGL